MSPAFLLYPCFKFAPPPASPCSSVVTAPRASRNTEPIVTHSGGGHFGIDGDGDNGGVVKRVRDMDYVKSPVIMRVKQSGELYVPNPEQVINELSNNIYYDIHK